VAVGRGGGAVVVVLSSRAICTSIFTCYFLHAFYLFIYLSIHGPGCSHGDDGYQLL